MSTAIQKKQVSEMQNLAYSIEVSKTIENKFENTEKLHAAKLIKIEKTGSKVNPYLQSL